jgi:hypothetical protein
LGATPVAAIAIETTQPSDDHADCEQSKPSSDVMVAIHEKKLQSYVDDGRLTEKQAAMCVDQYARQFPSLVVASFAIDDPAKRRALSSLFCEYGTKFIETAPIITSGLFTRLELQMFGIWWTKRGAQS